MREQLLNRFLRYVKIDTRSDENSGAGASTDKQFDLARLLVAELQELGLDPVELDDRCYVYARLDANLPEDHQTASGPGSPSWDSSPIWTPPLQPAEKM